MNWQLFEANFESFVGVNLWTMLFAWANLLIVYLFLRKLLFNPVKKMIDTRQSEIDGLYQDAQSSKDKADELLSQYEQKLEGAEGECEELLRAAQRKAQLREEEIIKEANEQAARTVRRAAEEVELEKKRAINEVKDEVSDMALKIAGAVIERDISPDDHESFIDDFIKNMGDTK